jgi:hypothetical protein
VVQFHWWTNSLIIKNEFEISLFITTIKKYSSNS